MAQPLRCIAFEGQRCLASGELSAVARQVKKRMGQNPDAVILIFEELTSQRVEIDLRGTMEDVLLRLEKRDSQAAREADQAGTFESRGPGRPRLGVVAREITLLPRHWEWLNSQPGGASVALRKLVEKARHEYAGRDRLRLAQESCYRFMSEMAGNEPGFEEATRALFAGNRAAFRRRVKSWPADVRDHSRKLAAAAFCAHREVMAEGVSRALP